MEIKYFITIAGHIKTLDCDIFKEKLVDFFDTDDELEYKNVITSLLLEAGFIKNQKEIENYMFISPAKNGVYIQHKNYIGNNCRVTIMPVLEYKGKLFRMTQLEKFDID